MMDFVTVEKGNAMAEYIDKEALRDALYGADAITMNGVKILNQFPSSDVEPVRHGRWIASHDEFCACSICKYPVYACWNQTNYCPNCGADMRGINDE